MATISHNSIQQMKSSFPKRVISISVACQNESVFLYQNYLFIQIFFIQLKNKKYVLAYYALRKETLQIFCTLIFDATKNP